MILVKENVVELPFVHHRAAGLAPIEVTDIVGSEIGP